MEMEEHASGDYQLYTMLKLNAVTKTIFFEHMKTLKVLRAIIDRIEEVDIDDDIAYARATHWPVKSLEANDSEEDLFKRRMGMRKYLNQLRLNLVRVRNAKEAKETKRIAAETEDTADDT